MASHSKQDIEYSLKNFSKDEKDHILTFLRDLQEHRRVERGSIRKWLKDDFYIIPASDMPDMLGITEKEIQVKTKTGDIPPREGNYQFRFYDLRKVLRFLWKKKAGGEENDVDKELKRKRIIGEDIKNKIRMGQWISKDKAEDRSTRILSAAMNMIQFAIKKAAPQLVGCPTATDAEKLMVMKFREAAELLKQEAENKEWAKEVSEDPELYFKDEDSGKDKA